MHTVMLHTMGPVEGQIDSVEEFAQVPAVGEHVCRDSDGDWYRVTVVVHIPRGVGAPSVAEVYATWVEASDVTKDAFKG